MITCKVCRKEMDPKIINSLHVDGFPDDDIICAKCTAELIDDRRAEAVIAFRDRFYLWDENPHFVAFKKAMGFMS